MKLSFFFHTHVRNKEVLVEKYYQANLLYKSWFRPQQESNLYTDKFFTEHKVLRYIPETNLQGNGNHTYHQRSIRHQVFRLPGHRRQCLPRQNYLGEVGEPNILRDHLPVYINFNTGGEFSLFFK